MPVIAGGGGYGCELAALLRVTARMAVGVVDDGSPDLQRLDQAELALLGVIDSAMTHATSYLVGVGYPRPRFDIASRLDALGLDPDHNVAHPTAALLEPGPIGPGSVFMPNCTVSRGVRAGRLLLVNYNASVGHDCVIGASVTIGPNAAVGGECNIGEQVLIGSGATVLQGLEIGERAVIGSGAVVTGDVEPGQIITGVPGRPRR